jgi:methyl-accepting chemotaxis protein
MLHPHAAHRSRQLRWILPLGLVLIAAALASSTLFYEEANQQVSDEFFKAHKTIHQTGEMLLPGLMASTGVLLTALVGVGIWAFYATHKVVRPVHTLHVAMDQLAAGDLGVRVELHRHDEFQEVGAAFNTVVDELNTTVTRVHRLAEEVDALAEQVAQDAHDQPAATRLHQLARELNEAMDFFRQTPAHTLTEETA